jgi:hypothetical protein
MEDMNSICARITARYEAKLTRDALAMRSTFVIAPSWS